MARSEECVASLLRESWSVSPPAFCGTREDISAALPILYATGAAGLAWWRLRDTEFASMQVGDELHNAFRMHSLQSAIHELAIRTVIPVLRDAGVEPLLVKGWAAARNYPKAGLRPYGDLDLCVSDFELAERVLANDNLRALNIDLHAGGQHLLDIPFAKVLAQSQLIDLDGVAVRIPSEEHHLRILCLHLLHHGAWRPLWLCDIGAALDAASDRFDWDIFLGTDPIRRGWMVCTLRLAESLIGADLSRVPTSVRTAELPRWLEGTVLREWSRSHRWSSSETIGATIARRPWAALAEIRRHWPDPIRACVAYGVPLERGWRSPYQVRYGLTRFGKVANQIINSGRHQSTPSATIRD